MALLQTNHLTINSTMQFETFNVTLATIALQSNITTVYSGKL